MTSIKRFIPGFRDQYEVLPTTLNEPSQNGLQKFWRKLRNRGEITLEDEEVVTSNPGIMDCKYIFHSYALKLTNSISVWSADAFRIGFCSFCFLLRYRLFFISCTSFKTSQIFTSMDFGVCFFPFIFCLFARIWSLFESSFLQRKSRLYHGFYIFNYLHPNYLCITALCHSHHRGLCGANGGYDLVRCELFPLWQTRIAAGFQYGDFSGGELDE